MDSQELEVNKYYQATAWDYKYLWRSNARALHFGFYDSTTKNHADSLAKMNEVLANKAGIHSGDRIVDAGCGVGGSSVWLAQHGCHVTGVNIVEDQLREAQKFAREGGVAEKISFIHADFADTGLPSDSQDIFWALESMVHASDRARVIGEAHRVLKPGGRVMICEYVLRENPTLTIEEREQLMPWLQGWAMPALLTNEEYGKILKTAGFDNLNISSLNTFVRPSLLRLEKICKALLPGAKFMKFLKLFTPERVANMEASIHQVKTFKQGLWNYQVIVAEKLRI